MSLVMLVLTIAVVGFVCWLVLRINMPETFRQIIIGIVVLGLIVYLLQAFGLIHGHALRLL